jgi:thioredoxin-like negative regulator of GroEL
MSTERLQQLRAMLAEEPSDAFIRYAIALELKRAGQMEQAANDLGTLITEDPKYIACYYQLALILAAKRARCSASPRVIVRHVRS